MTTQTISRIAGMRDRMATREHSRQAKPESLRWGFAGATDTAKSWMRLDAIARRWNRVVLMPLIANGTIGPEEARPVQVGKPTCRPHAARWVSHQEELEAMAYERWLMAPNPTTPAQEMESARIRLAASLDFARWSAARILAAGAASQHNAMAKIQQDRAIVRRWEYEQAIDGGLDGWPA